jgi:hypothetical protein
MLRKSLVALMMGALCAGSAMAEDTAPKPSKAASTGIVGWFKNKAGGLRGRKGQEPETAKSSPAAAPLTDKLAANARPSAKKPSANSGKSSRTQSKSTARASQPGGGIERAVIADAEKQSVAIRQTSGRPQDTAEFVHEQPQAPVEILQQPVLPNISSQSGPQYFSATAAGMSNPIPVHPSGNWQTYQAPMPTYLVSQGPYWNVSNPGAPAGPQYVGSAPMTPQSGGGMYPQTGAALYPAPHPGIPHQVGGTATINQAFQPHEYLYPHRYKALYPPYYYRVNGGWMVTPFGVWSREDWHLQGTQVDVRYKSHISPFAHFVPPVIR